MQKNFYKIIYFFIAFLLSNSFFGQIKKRTNILKENTINTYEEQEQKEKIDKSPKIIFSDRDDNYTYEAPYSSKVKSKLGLAKPLYVINENESYYEVVYADEKLLGKPEGLLAFFKSKEFHFKDTKEVKYLGWIKKNNIIEFKNAQQNQENLRYVKYLVACNNLKTLYKGTNAYVKNEIVLTSDPSLEILTKNKVNLNDFVYVFKINQTNKSAFISNSNNLVVKDTVSQKKGWISLDYITPLLDNIVVQLDENELIKFPIKKNIILGNQLYKKTFFVNENQSKNTVNFNKRINFILPANVWNHEKNKITNLNGDDISMDIISQIETENKKINLFYVFDNAVGNKQNLKKILASIQNIKISITKPEFASYTFSYSFLAKASESYFLLKSNSFSEWFDLIEKSIKSPEEIESKNVLPANNNVNLNQFLSDKNTYENTFFIIAGTNTSIHSILPNDTNKLIKNSAKILFIVLENKNSIENQSLILQNKSYLNTASSNNKKFIRNYYVDLKLLREADEFTFSDEFDNSYIFDAPLKSNFNGGIVFPKYDKDINPKTVNYAIDSILQRTIQTNSLLLQSLKSYRNEFSFLRSQTSNKLNEQFDIAGIDKSKTLDITKNYKNENFVFSTNDSINASLDKKIYLLMNKDEIRELIENYRELVATDYIEENTTKSMIFNFKDKAKLFMKNRNKTNKVRSYSTLADLFFNKTGVMVNSIKLHETQINDIRKMKRDLTGFKNFFTDLNAKLLELEKKQRTSDFEVFNEDAAVKYYYVSKQLLL